MFFFGRIPVGFAGTVSDMNISCVGFSRGALPVSDARVGLEVSFKREGVFCLDRYK